MVLQIDTIVKGDEKQERVRGTGFENVSIINFNLFKCPDFHSELCPLEAPARMRQSPAKSRKTSDYGRKLLSFRQKQGLIPQHHPKTPGEKYHLQR